MGTSYYAIVPKLKIAFYIGRNNMDIELVEYIYNKIKIFSNMSEQVMCNKLKNLTLSDIKKLLALADIGEDIISFDETLFLLIYLKSLNIEYEIVPDYEVPKDGYILVDSYEDID